MGDVDQIADMFSISREKAKQIYEGLSDPDPVMVARVLERAAERGKVPERDYMSMVPEDEAELLEIPAEDPLDEPPEADPASEHNQMRAEQAMRWAENNRIDDRAEQIAAGGSLADIVAMINKLDTWGNEALLHPNRSSLPDRFETALDDLVEGAKELFDAWAERGEVGRLEEARDTINTLHNDELKKGLNREIDAMVNLAHGSGTEFEDAKAWALAENLGPYEMLTRVEAVPHKYDVSYGQQERIMEGAKAWLEEYEEVAADLEGDDVQV